MFSFAEPFGVHVTQKKQIKNRKMKKLLLFQLIFLSTQILSQVYQKTYLFKDDFTDNTSVNNWSVVNNATYSASITDEQYRCYLPYDNKQKWNWTWVNIPENLTEIFNQSQDINLDFDFTFIGDESNTNFGLMFDLHQVTRECPGGSFYELYFTRVDDKIQTAFRKNDNCSLGEAKYFKQGRDVALKNMNHLNILKNGLQWTVSVNKEVVLDLYFSGNIRLDKLKYGKGEYIFDDFSAFSTNVKLPDQPKQIVKESVEIPRIWALCVGINDYSNYPGYPHYISNLNSCVDDAKSYYSFLSSLHGGKVPENQLVFLSDSEATNSNILIKGSELFAQASDNDLIIVFLAGHGGNGFYCAGNNPLRYEELNKMLELSKAKRKLLIADACYSGTWATQKDIFASSGVKLNDDESMRLFYSELAKSGRNVVYLLAARPGEVSWETEGHGVFTYFLLKGLECEAKTNGPLIALGDIYNYVYRNVYNETKDNDLDGKPSPQHPVLEGKYDKEMPVSICND